MPTILTARTPVTTTYNLTRLWWEYLLDWNWDYILDSEGERIIVIVRGWQLTITVMTGRPVYHQYTYAELWTQTYADLGTQTYADLFEWNPPTPYTVRTPI